MDKIRTRTSIKRIDGKPMQSMKNPKKFVYAIAVWGSKQLKKQPGEEKQCFKVNNEFVIDPADMVVVSRLEYMELKKEEYIDPEQKREDPTLDSLKERFGLETGMYVRRDKWKLFANGKPVVKIDSIRVRHSIHNIDMYTLLINGTAEYEASTLFHISEEEANKIMDIFDGLKIVESIDNGIHSSCYRDGTGEKKQSIPSEKKALEILFGFKMTKENGHLFEAYKCNHCSMYHIGKTTSKQYVNELNTMDKQVIGVSKFISNKFTELVKWDDLYRNGEKIVTGKYDILLRMYRPVGAKHSFKTFVIVPAGERPAINYLTGQEELDMVGQAIKDKNYAIVPEKNGVLHRLSRFFKGMRIHAPK